MKNQFKFSVMLAVLALAGFQSHAQVVDGDFATDINNPPAPDGWTLTRATDGSLVGYGSGFSATGGSSFEYAGVGDPSSFPGSYDEISQDVGTTANTIYALSFWLDGANDSYFRAYFGGANVFEADDAGWGSWTQYTVDVTATGASTTLGFYGLNDPSVFYLSDVSLTAIGTAGVPDSGSSLALMATALTGLCAVARKLGRRSVA